MALTRNQLSTLRARVEGSLVPPGADGWEGAVRLWNADVTKLPALVLQPTSPDDVVAAVRFARAHGLRLGVKGGGHNIAGTAIPEGGLMLDMARMRSVAVDPAARLARVGPGCQLGDVDRAAQEHGLATPLGFFSEVGVAGLTLGGGLGYLTRRFGWTVDNLKEVEIVTADGVIRTASRTENPDLFWALRGGGGNFGVVTRFTYRLHPVGPTVYGGLIAWPFARAPEVFETYRTLTRDAPRELAVWLVCLRPPPAPFVPPEWHRKQLCAMAVCYSGDLAEVDTAIAPIRRLGDPVVDLLRPQPYVEVQSYLNGVEPKGNHYYWKTEFVRELSHDLLATLRELFAECPIPDGDVGILHLGGALNERDGDDGAVGNRDARFVLGLKAMWQPNAPHPEAYRRWIREAWVRIRPFSTGGTYINFQTADEDADRIRATYAANYDRLSAIKCKYDPENFFRENRNIRPEG